MGKVNYISRWKAQLEDTDKRQHLLALIEMVEMLNNSNKEKGSATAKLRNLINSDICHFISEIMSYRETNAMNMINKIVCYMSEISDFFSNGFLRIFKGYIRVLSSIPIREKEDPSAVQNHRNIFTTINFIVKR